jgi:hypothetical protein
MVETSYVPIVENDQLYEAENTGNLADDMYKLIAR